MRTIWTCILLNLLLTVSVLGAATIKDIEGILEEQQESVVTLQTHFNVKSTILYPLDSSQIEEYNNMKNGIYDVVVESGKIYTCLDRTPLNNQASPYIWRMSWNGNTAYTGTLQGNHARNSVRSMYHEGSHSIPMSLIEDLGVNPKRVFGSYDRTADHEMARITSPLVAIHRVERDDNKYEFIKVKDVTYEGKDCVVLSLHSKSDKFTSPMADYILDPEQNFACLEFRLYDGHGVMRRTRLKWGQKNNNRVLEKSRIERLVRHYNRKGYQYPEEDNDKIASVQEISFEKFIVNEEIDPVVYEPEHVYFPKSEIWDDNFGINITEELSVAEEIIAAESDRLLNTKNISEQADIAGISENNAPEMSQRLIHKKEVHTKNEFAKRKEQPPEGIGWNRWYNILVLCY